MPDMTPYHQIVELVQWMRSGEASGETVSSHLDVLSADLDEWTRKVESIPPPPDTYDESRVLLDTSLQGLALFREAVARARAYVENRDEADAEQAIGLAREGVEIILRVKGTTEDNIERILDEVES